MLAVTEKIAAADRTGAVLLGLVTMWRGVVYMPWTPELSYTHPVETLFSTDMWSVAWLAIGALVLVSGIIRPRSIFATMAWSTAVMLHLFFGLSMIVAVVQGHFAGYMSAGTCMAIAGFAVWGSARKKPVQASEVTICQE